MQILDRTQANNTLNIIPRSYEPTGAAIFKIIVKNEEQNTEVHNTTITSFTALKYYYTYTANLGFDTTKDLSYLLEITDTTQSSVIFRDKIFATDQAISTYSANTGKFVSNTSDSNDYLVYE